jgi:hypothetical protein
MLRHCTCAHLLPPQCMEGSQPLQRSLCILQHQTTTTGFTCTSARQHIVSLTDGLCQSGQSVWQQGTSRHDVVCWFSKGCWQG